MTCSVCGARYRAVKNPKFSIISGLYGGLSFLLMPLSLLLPIKINLPLRIVLFFSFFLFLGIAIDWYFQKWKKLE